MPQSDELGKQFLGGRKCIDMIARRVLHTTPPKWAPSADGGTVWAFGMTAADGSAIFNSCNDEPAVANSLVDDPTQIYIPRMYLPFAAHWTDVARPLLNALPERFIAVHLRIEDDFQYQCDTIKKGDPTCLIFDFVSIEHCLLAHFARGETVYIASSEQVLRTPAFAEWRRWSKLRLVVKGDFVTGLFDNYGHEELAILEAIVLLQATRLVGFSHSTFSVSLAQQRREIWSPWTTNAATFRGWGDSTMYVGPGRPSFFYNQDKKCLDFAIAHKAKQQGNHQTPNITGAGG
jgi:hypothetical protein